MHAELVAQINRLLVRARAQAPEGTAVYPSIPQLIMRAPVSMAEVRRWGKGETVPGIQDSNRFIDETDMNYMIEYLNGMMDQWAEEDRLQEFRARILTVLSEDELEEFTRSFMPTARG